MSRNPHNPTQNFRQGYNVNPSQNQMHLYQQHQQQYNEMPSGTSETLEQLAADVNARKREYERRKDERRQVAADTEPARRARKGPDDPDIQRYRNAMNREERALASLEHAQRRYNDFNARASTTAYANTVNGNYNNMTNVASRNMFPVEMVDSITRRVDVPAYPQRLPAPREQKAANIRRGRDRE